MSTLDDKTYATYINAVKELLRRYNVSISISGIGYQVPPMVQLLDFLSCGRHSLHADSFYPPLPQDVPLKEIEIERLARGYRELEDLLIIWRSPHFLDKQARWLVEWDGKHDCEWTICWGKNRGIEEILDAYYIGHVPAADLAA